MPSTRDAKMGMRVNWYAWVTTLLHMSLAVDSMGTLVVWDSTIKEARSRTLLYREKKCQGQGAQRT